MKIVFVSNFFNHHQKALTDALYSKSGNNYYFIETAPISQERIKMGWGRDKRPSYILQNYRDEDSKNQCQQIIDDSDVVILGSAPYSLLSSRLKNKKLTFLYTERLYKEKYEAYKFPVRVVRFFKKYGRHKNLFLLCASAYTSADFAKTFTFLNKAYKWGYFPEVKRYDDIDSIVDTKKTSSILWVARFIDLKHPEVAIEVAKRLKKNGYKFELNMIGNGVLEAKIQELIEENNLNDCVNLLGSMKPEEVRSYMEESEIFIFTSDRNEGWGAVLNESMNSACAVVASHAIGSVPFVVEDKENGLIYKDGDIDDLYNKVKWLLDNESERRKIAINAYNTMINEWNAENAAEKFLLFSKKLLNGEKNSFLYADGVCSKAEILKDDWKK